MAPPAKPATRESNFANWLDTQKTKTLCEKLQVTAWTIYEWKASALGRRRIPCRPSPRHAMQLLELAGKKLKITDIWPPELVPTLPGFGSPSPAAEDTHVAE